ncbi:MAG: hypothetical protein VB062_04570 [Christensenella sp.]|nr:hypothetical protein [Christensenella sp.]
MDNLVHILDANYIPITQPIDSYSSLSYEDKWDDYGSFKLVCSPSLFQDITPGKRVRVNGKTFLLDGIKTKDVTANKEMSLSGRGLKALLDKVVNPAPIRIRGNMEAQIRSVVAALATTGFQAVNKFALAPAHGCQNSIDIVVPRGSLGKWLLTTLNLRGFSYTIEYDQYTDTVVFDIVQEADRSNDQTVNAPVIFSAQVGNIENVEYSKSDADACNLAIVYDDETGEVVYVDESDGEEKRALIVQGKSANIASDGGLFVVVGDTGKIFTSANGLSFSLKSTSGLYQTNSINYVAGEFVLIGYDSGAIGRIDTSTDGITWTTVNTIAGRNLQRIIYNDGLYIITARGFSTDADKTWVLSGYDLSDLTETAFGLDTSGTPSLVNGSYVIPCVNQTTDEAVFYASDYGIDWERHAFPLPAHDVSAGQWGGFSNVISFSGELIALGFVNPIGASAKTLLIAKTADNFETCEIKIINGLTGASSAIVHNGVIVTAGNTIMYSADGESFNFASGLAGYQFDGGVVSDGATLHAYSYIGKKHVYSTNGIDWTMEDLPIASTYVYYYSYGASSQHISMAEIGRAALQEARSVEVIDGDILPGVAPIIGTDCNVGDIVSVVGKGIAASKRLVSAKTVIEPKSHYTVPKFGTDYLSLTSFIKKEIAKNV